MSEQKSTIWMKFVTTSVLLGLSFLVLIFPLLATMGIGVKLGSEVFEDLPSELETLPPSQQSVILAADGSTIATFYAQNRIVIPISKMSKHIQDAIVAIEDKRFYEHKGVDIEGMGRAFVRNLLGQSLEGASTLTQQYVKNALLDTAIQKGDERAAKKAVEPTISRKLREAKYAVALEKKLKKKEILQGYLNIASFGAKVYGVEAASQYYFGHSAEKLTLDESTLLAGITQSPVTLDPVVNPENAKARQITVASVMLQQKKITHEDYDRIKNTPVKDLLNIHDNQQGCATAGNSAYFCSYVVNEVEKLKELGKTEGERRKLLLRGGLTIKTTLDPKKQEEAFESMRKVVPVNDKSNVKVSVTSVEPGTGKILAMTQNTVWGSPTEENPTATEVSFAADQSHGGGYGKQTGSTFKVFSLAEWFNNGFGGYDKVGGKYSYPASAWNIPCAPGSAANYSFKDFNGRANGATSVVEGTKQSLNSVYMAMAQKMNLCNITDLAGKMGVKHGNNKPISTNPSAILGSNEVPPLYMTNAFASFAARGKYCKPKAIVEVIKHDGEKVRLSDQSCKQVIDENVIDKANVVLNKTWANYSAPLAGRQAAAKTGSTDNNTNLWFIGYTPNLATGIWIGHSEGDVPLINVTIGGRFYPVVYGETLGARIWSGYMNQIVKDLPNTGFVSADIGKTNSDDDKDDEDKDEEKKDEEKKNDFSDLPPPPPGYEYVYVDE
ncbi:penicillin-binding protein [Actinomyces sp. zg-332]|uniref:transglycosylase domain-containing protein n=1 Tax=Actinomyces sp. zg-332 TaxID=2708340 RepID=UPI0014202EDC|nr:transglycosylase domain-containing protein [Actinomyces sp. zg-332]QPK94104.1 penicillin-binding protein [Actinomyces sp. zg-332]